MDRPLRPLTDSIAERVQACTTCHGAQGRATADGYFPRLAGKPAGYLFHQLQNFRDGRRQHAVMAGLLRNMSDDYLREIAGYFASLKLPYPAPGSLTLSAEQRERAQRLIERGDAARRLPACAACHGAGLAGREPAVPGLLGLPRDYLISQLGAWRSGLRQAHAPDCMARIAKALEPEEVVAVAGWLAQQVPGAAAEAPAVGADRGGGAGGLVGANGAAPLPMTCGGVTP